jgi:dTMP kinase
VEPLHDELKRLAGRFVVFEGPDGCGKTTQLGRLERACEAAGVAVTRVREPGGTAVGEAVREILLSKATVGLSMTAEMLLYMAARAQLVETVIRPALDRGACVLADRFVPSTRAYQGAAGGLDDDQINEVARIATGGLCPDLIVLIDIDEATAATRLGMQLDRIESRGVAFQRKVRASYLAQAKSDPDRWAVIDGAAGEEAVWERVQSALGNWIDSTKINRPTVGGQSA